MDITEHDIERLKDAIAHEIDKGVPVSPFHELFDRNREGIIQMLKNGFTVKQIHGVMVNSGIQISYQTVRCMIEDWRKELGLYKAKARTGKRKERKNGQVCQPDSCQQ